MKKNKNNYNPEYFDDKDLLCSKVLDITDCRKGTYLICDLEPNDFFLYYGDLCMIYSKRLTKNEFYHIYTVLNLSKLTLVDLDYCERVTPVKVRIEIEDLEPYKKLKKYSDDEEED